jgi:photosystem II stability/assembly factor-like uncharacterized protein
VIGQSVVSQFWESPAEIIASAVSHAGGIMVVNGRPHWSIWKPKLAISLVLIAIASLLLFAASHLSGAQASATRTVRPVIRSNIQQTPSLTDTYTYYFPLVFRDYRVPTWRSTGLQANNVNVIAVDPISPSVLYVGVSGTGVYKSSDSGTSWQQVNAGLPLSPTIYLVAIDPSHTQNVYIGLTSYPRFYYSENGGQSWSPGGGLQHMPGALSAHPTITRRLYVGVGQFEGSGGELFRSDDGGMKWTEVLSKQVAARSIVIAPQDPLIYAGGRNIYRSEDGGDSWTQITTDLPDSQVWDIALHPTSPLTAYVGMSDGIFKTTNKGDNWSLWGIELPSGGVRKLRIDSRQPKNQYATFYCQGVYASSDEGQHWHAMNGGLGNLCVNDLLLDVSSGHLYAATQDGIWVINLIKGE